MLTITLPDSRRVTLMTSSTELTLGVQLGMLVQSLADGDDLVNATVPEILDELARMIAPQLGYQTVSRELVTDPNYGSFVTLVFRRCK